MNISARRDPEVVDTVSLLQDTDQYVAVNRDGSIAGRSADAFGITMASGENGDPVPVCIFGFCPIQVITAADNNAAGSELIVWSSGKLDGIPSPSEVGTPISSVDTTNDIISVEGDYTDSLSAGDEFEVHNSTGNDGTYTVASIGYDGVETNISTNESVSDSTADGEIIVRETAYIIARTEEETSVDGAQTGAWIDCVSLGRSRQIPASI